MDNIIQVTTVLLILSLVTERIANLVKLQRWFEPDLSSLTGKELDTAREKYAQKLSIASGILIALVIKADLFGLITQEHFTFFWECGDFSRKAVIGSLLTGVFLSLGSQFFHDLLAILFQVKNLKNKLNDLPDVRKFNSLEEADEHMLYFELESFIYQITGEHLQLEVDYKNQLAKVNLTKAIDNFPKSYFYKSLTRKDMNISIQTL